MKRIINTIISSLLLFFITGSLQQVQALNMNTGGQLESLISIFGYKL